MAEVVEGVLADWGCGDSVAHVVLWEAAGEGVGVGCLRVKRGILDCFVILRLRMVFLFSSLADAEPVFSVARSDCNAIECRARRQKRRGEDVALYFAYAVFVKGKAPFIGRQRLNERL